MNRTASLSGDTLIACHFPLVQLSPWQLPVTAALCSSSAKRPGRSCSSSVGLTRAASLPEQDNLHREPFQSSLQHISSSYRSLKEDRGEEDGDGEGGSVSSGRCDSGSSPEEVSDATACRRHEDQAEVKGPLRSHNSFLHSDGVDDEEEDSEGDNLHRYHEDYSFVLQLHGNSNWAQRNDGRRTAKPYQPPGQQHHEPRGETSPTDFGEQQRSEDVEDDLLKCGNEGYCFSYGQGKCLPDSCSDGHLENVTDSSCNSSDGVLVNFSAIYNKSNNPADTQNLRSPAVQSSQPADGSVFLNLHSFPQKPQEPHVSGSIQGDRATSSPLDRASSFPGSSPHSLDSNCNVYLPDTQGLLSSPEVSDITSCLQGQVRLLPTGTTQKYYKLVTCDLSSKSASPSPAWSSTTSVTSEGHYFLFSKAQGEPGQTDQHQEQGLDKGRRATPLHRPRSMTWDSSFSEMAHCKRNTDFCQSSSHSHTSLDPCSIQEADSLGKINSHYPSPKQGSGTMSHYPAVSTDHYIEEDEGACSWAPPVVRYSKAQRPTSLPIQPFLLLSPAGQPQNQPLGSLLDQYIVSKNTKPGSSSQLGSKCKGKATSLLTHLHPSQLGSYGAILLEGPSSSETCSTCTPSPEGFQCKRNWTQYSPYRPPTSPEISSTSPKQAQNKVKQSCAEQTQGHSRQGQHCAQLDLTGAGPDPGYAGPDHVHAGPGHVYRGPDHVYAGPDHVYTRPDHVYRGQNQFQHKDSIKRSQGMAQICQDLLCLSPEEKSSVPVHLNRSPQNTVSSHVAPPAGPFNQPDPASTPPKKTMPSPVPVAGSVLSHCSLTAALSSVAPLSSLGALLQPLASSNGKPRPPQHCDLIDSGPPVEFCQSPEASYESLSISHLQRRGLLKSVSLAVDLIMAHFGTSRDPGEKIRLGNSSRSPTIVGLVLEHLCPSIQNILQDGLRDHRLDLIIGQRRNHAWNVVEASTQTGPATRVLHSLLSKVTQCHLLASNCMRLRAFIMGLLNLRALEFWLNHLYGQKDVVASLYHSWGFLAMSQGRCQSLFQELLLLLQPLSMLPFDLNLLLEPRLLHNRQLCSEEQAPPCSTFLMTSWPLLRADRDRHRPYGSMDGARHNSRPTDDPHRLIPSQGSSLGSKAVNQVYRVGTVGESSSSQWPSTSPGWWQRPPAYTEAVVEGVECGTNYLEVVHAEAPPGTAGRREEERSPEGSRMGRGSEAVMMTADPQMESPSRGWLRWAKLFGAGGDAPARTQRASQNLNGTQRRPSQWLHLDRSQLGMLAHKVWSGKLPAPHPNMKHPP